MDTATQFGLYIAGIRVPFVGVNVGSQFGSMASLSISIPYSPFILRLHEQTKIHLLSRKIINGVMQEPKLEFDGILVGAIRSRNVLGQASAQLTCMTDGYIWNRRKQYDFYLEQIANADVRGTGENPNIRADGVITNYYDDLLSDNRFDTGCAAASVLTTIVYGKCEEGKFDEGVQVIPTYYEYIYNGNKFSKRIEGDEASQQSDGVIANRDLTPTYYRRYLEKHKLANKVYGISTSSAVKTFYQTDHFIKTVSNSLRDLQGENTFWSIAAQVMQYGFYSVYDIPNPTFVRGKTSDPSKVSSINLSAIKSRLEDGAITDSDSAIRYGGEITVSKKENRKLHGLAEYILKPISVLGLPLKCNIIWPEQVVSESFYYDFMSAPTRVSVTRHAIPGDDNGSTVLTTTKVVGPAFPEAGDHYFKSFNAFYKEFRDMESYSDYEKEYGINYRPIPLSYAFDASLLSEEGGADDKEDDAVIKEKNVVEITRKMRDFVNYNFTQFFYASRSYNIAVTPDVEIVPGLPVIILNRDGEHVIAFATGVQKSFDASNGNLNVQVSLNYPRYYYENIEALGNVVDPSSIGTQEEMETAISEMEVIFGSQRLINPGEYAQLANKIDTIFAEYIKHDEDGRQVMREEYSRSVCSYSEFLEFHTDTPAPLNAKFKLVDEMPIRTFESSELANGLSHRYFRVYNHRKKAVEVYDPTKQPLSNKAIVKKHLEWTSEDQKI